MRCAAILFAGIEPSVSGITVPNPEAPTPAVAKYSVTSSSVDKIRTFLVKTCDRIVVQNRIFRIEIRSLRFQKLLLASYGELLV